MRELCMIGRASFPESVCHHSPPAEFSSLSAFIITEYTVQPVLRHHSRVENVLLGGLKVRSLNADGLLKKGCRKYRFESILFFSGHDV